MHGREIQKSKGVFKMQLFPAIDIRGGNAVRLFKGDFDREKIYSRAPAEVARAFKQAGAECLHIVDLDGAREGAPVNSDVIKQIISEGGFFAEVGGGVRSLTRIEQYLNAGAGRVILGSAAVENFTLVTDAVKFFGDGVAVGVDAVGGKVAVEGWKKITDTDAFEFCRKLKESGVRTIIFTDISRDGTLTGANLAAYERLVSECPGVNVVASGGITHISELIKLKHMGAGGAILGKAIYDGAIDLSQAVRAVRDAG